MLIQFRICKELASSEGRIGRDTLRVPFHLDIDPDPVVC